MRHGLLACLVVVALAGCGKNEPDHLILDNKWEPLRRLECDRSVPPGVFRNHGVFVATGSIRVFLDRPEVDQDGVLVHEQLHSLRQQQYPGGFDSWQALYETDPSFRWQEESVAWARQIRHVLTHGGRVDPGYVANFLATGYGDPPMINLSKAQEWVGAAIRGEDQTIQVLIR